MIEDNEANDNDNNGIFLSTSDDNDIIDNEANENEDDGSHFTIPKFEMYEDVLAEAGLQGYKDIPVYSHGFMNNYDIFMTSMREQKPRRITRMVGK